MVNVNNGSRLVTYAISGKRGTGIVELNGPAARLGMTGDKVIVLAYAQMSDTEARAYKPKIVHVTEKNRLRKK